MSCQAQASLSWEPSPYEVARPHTARTRWPAPRLAIPIIHTHIHVLRIQQSKKKEKEEKRKKVGIKIHQAECAALDKALKVVHGTHVTFRARARARARASVAQ